MDTITADNGATISYDSYFVDESGNTIFTYNGNYVGIMVVDTGQITAITGSVSDSSAISIGGSSSVNTYTQLLTALGGAVSSWQLNQINIGRAKNGLSPINAAAYGPQVGIGLNQQTMTYLAYGAVGLAAVFLLSRRKS